MKNIFRQSKVAFYLLITTFFLSGCIHHGHAMKKQKHPKHHKKHLTSVTIVEPLDSDYLSEKVTFK